MGPALLLLLLPGVNWADGREYDAPTQKLFRSSVCVRDSVFSHAIAERDPAFCSQYSNSDKWGRAIQEVRSVKRGAVTLAEKLRDVRPYVACGFMNNEDWEHLEERVATVLKRTPKKPKKNRVAAKECLTYWEAQIECVSLAAGNSARLTRKAMVYDLARLPKDCPLLDALDPADMPQAPAPAHPPLPPGPPGQPHAQSANP